MTARTDQLELPSLKWLLGPVAGFALLAAVMEAVRRRIQTPRVSPMSEQWLRDHANSDSDLV